MVYYLSLGSNLGEREQTIRRALELIGQQVGTVLRCSSFYYSEPWGFTSEHPFCNLCCAVETSMEPLAVLAATQSIERALGRTKKSYNPDSLSGEAGLSAKRSVSASGLSAQAVYSDRTIDIDLIQVFDDAGSEITCSTPTLTLPHPLWSDRPFVRIPLEEIK